MKEKGSDSKNRNYEGFLLVLKGILFYAYEVNGYVNAKSVVIEIDICIILFIGEERCCDRIYA